jgi:hypothetical protein
MKIIANTEHGYLCELSRREVSLIGLTAPKINDVVELDKAYAILDSLRGLSKSNISYLGENIKRLQEKYADIIETYEKLMLLDNIKNNGDRNE